MDFELLRDGEVKAYAEVKTRRNARRAYPTYCVDRDKWQALTRLHRQTGKPALLVVAFTDGLHYVAAEDQPYRVGVMERKDRGDPNDRDVVVHIPVGELRAIAANHGG